MHPLLCVVFVKVPNQVCILPQIHTLPTKKQKKCNSVESLSSELNVFGGGKKKKVARPPLSFFVFFPDVLGLKSNEDFKSCKRKGQGSERFGLCVFGLHPTSKVIGWMQLSHTQTWFHFFLPKSIRRLPKCHIWVSMWTGWSATRFSVMQIHWNIDPPPRPIPNDERADWLPHDCVNAHAEVD